MKYIYGPLNSRRLGLSLGITLVPHKTCSFDCVYCQLGKTREKTKERKEYIAIEEILNELRLWLQNNSPEAKKINYITLSGSGEPTLNIKIGQLITEIKRLTSLPVAVITNSSLLADSAIRREIGNADLIVPSLDAVTGDCFEKVDRPHSQIKIEDIIEGLVNLRKEFRGKIWLEVMLARGLNDDLRHIKRLKAVIDRVNPDKIHLNSPVRVTSEENISCVDNKKLNKIKEILGDKCQII
ncbi:MAG: radical SAM protein [Candidatus Omnitrophica bacterium]|nr:radical SAM protein [Candidatus Omnitrophota bacterium]MBU4345736.1 radical SAM protein [Candidatus Omnitrophota bacterium]MBU4473135.1 radical SAM protein [Candidatus Omnitrophota bacterium]